VPRRSTVLACVVAVVGSAADVSCLILLVRLGVPVAPAAGACAALASTISFFGNKYVAFRDPAPLHARQVLRYVLVAATTALLLAGSMQVVSVWLGVPYLSAKAACHTTLFFAWSLPAQRRWVFPTVPAP
jgi:putative flippase GtrA